MPRASSETHSKAASPATLVTLVTSRTAALTPTSRSEAFFNSSNTNFIFQRQHFYL